MVINCPLDVLYIRGREDAHSAVQLPLPPFCIVLVDDLDDVSRVDVQFIILLSLISIEHLTLTNICSNKEQFGGPVTTSFINQILLVL